MRRSLKKPTVLLVLSIVVGLLPILSVMLAALISNASGCVVHEGGVNPCIVLGADIGQLLYTLRVMGWFMLFSIPLGAIGILIATFWMSFILLAFIQRRH